MDQMVQIYDGETRSVVEVVMQRMLPFLQQLLSQCQLRDPICKKVNV